jgi:hypothetical protein
MEENSDIDFSIWFVFVNGIFGGTPSATNSDVKHQIKVKKQQGPLKSKSKYAK